MPFLPDVLELGQFPVGMNAVSGILGGILAFLLAGWSARRRQSNPEAAQDIVLNFVLGSIVAAKLFYVLRDPGSYLANPLTLLLFPYGPLALPVGLPGGAAAVAWGLRSRPDRLAVLDAAAIPFLLGLAVAAAGWKEPGSWAFAPALGLAGVAAAAELVRPPTVPSNRPNAFPGLHAAHAAVLTATALALADLARPVAGLVAGITTLQLGAGLVGTASWLWARRTGRSLS